MKYLEALGFIIFRLKNEKKENEFLYYIKKTKKYYNVSSGRLKQLIELELRDNNIDLKEFIIKEYNLDIEQNKNLGKEIENIFNSWINKEVILVDNVNFKPIKEIVFEENGSKYFNIYSGPNNIGNEKYNIISNSTEKFKSITKVILHLVNYDSKAYDYFLMWLAHIIRYPNDKISTAIIFQGTQGTGKGQFFKFVLKPIFEDTIRTINLNDLQKSSSNEWIFGKLLIFAEEIMNNDNKQEIPQVIKTYIGNDEISVQRMHKTGIDMKNYTNWILCSNKPNPIQLEDWDRRYNVFKQLKPISQDIINEFRENANEELNHFISFLYSLKLDKELLLRPIETEARNDLIDLNKDTIETFIDDMTLKGKRTLISGLNSLNIEIQYDRKPEGTFIPSRVLYDCYTNWADKSKLKNPFTQGRFTQHLKFKGWEGKVARIQNISANCIIVPKHLELGEEEHNENYSKEELDKITIDLSGEEI